MSVAPSTSYAPRLTPERDFPILHKIYDYDGMLSLDQIHRWFFGSRRRAEIRIKQLCDADYLKRSSREQLPFSQERIVWLSKRGAQALANWLGVEYKTLAWRKRPRWSRVRHDIWLNDFRHMMTQAVHNHPRYEVASWHGQDALQTLFSEPIAYLDHRGRQGRKRVQPDGYFCLANREDRQAPLRFCVELDNNSESNRRFGRDKVSPGVHLLRSESYRRAAGANTGRFLVVTVGSEARFHHLRSTVTQFGGAGYFLFARVETLTAHNVLTDPLWYLSHLDDPVSLETYDTPEIQAYIAETLHDAARAVPTLALLPQPLI